MQLEITPAPLDQSDVSSHFANSRLASPQPRRKLASTLVRLVNLTQYHQCPMSDRIYPEENGLLTCLTKEQHAKYFPRRKFVERHKVKRPARDPGTGQMGMFQMWDPIEPVEPVDRNDFPTDDELASLSELAWVQTHLDRMWLGSLVCLLEDPKQWPDNQGGYVEYWSRFMSHPGLARDTLYPLSSKMAGILVGLETFDFARDMRSDVPLHSRNYDHLVGDVLLRRAISEQARLTLNCDSNKLVFWARDPCNKNRVDF